MIAATLALAAALWNAGPFREPVAPETVVASATDIEGRVEITAERLALYCEAHPDVSPRAAAEDLVVFELLAREAARRGLAAAPEVAREGAAAAVPRYLKRHFEPEVGPGSIPRAVVERAYDRNLGMFVRPEFRRADHILVGTPEFKPWTRPSDAEAARRLAERIAAHFALHPPADAAAFRAAALPFEAEAKSAGLALKVETLAPFSIDGPLVRPFSEAAFALKGPGAVSAPVATDFGLHVIRLDGLEPAINRRFDEAEAEIRERLLPEFRLQKLRQHTEALLEAAGVAVDPAALEEPSKRAQ
ncbi:peptidyl-prolyl cis-trans isomerase [Myxococcota bacterium]|nr:peptidyl-prolyl cis-trans isomerase [Myxococcota bacterium]